MPESNKPSPRRIVSALQEPMFSSRTGKEIAICDAHMYVHFDPAQEKPGVTVVLSERQENLKPGYLPVEVAAPTTLGIMLHTANEEWRRFIHEMGGGTSLAEERRLQPEDLRVFIHTPRNSRVGVTHDRFEEQRYSWTEGPKPVIREQGDRPAIPVDPAVVRAAIGVDNFNELHEKTRQPVLAPQQLQPQPEWDMDL